MELREYWRVITKRWWLVLFIPLIAAFVSGYYSYKMIAPIYQATSAILLNVGNTPPDAGTIQGVVTSQTFDDAIVADHPGIGFNETELSQILSVNLTGDILYISAISTTQALAATAADAAANTFINDGSNLMGMPSARWVNHAISSGKPPISPHKKKDVGMAFALGLLVSLGLAFMLEYLDMRVKNEADMIRFLQIPVLGNVQDYQAKLKKVAR